MRDTYQTIRGDGQSEIEIKKSRFITSLKRVYSEEEAKAFIAGLKKEHWKANHNCSAYLIGDNSEIQRSSDDGEPSGTAGVPMLEVLKKNQLVNVCVVVTRYFGGTKLGAGGLIRAYSHAVSQGLKDIGLVIGKLQQELRLTIDYSLLGKLQNFLDNDWFTKDTSFAEKVTVVCLIDEDKTALFEAAVIDLLSGQVTIDVGPTSYQELPLETAKEELFLED
ncbi:YigZ family protein [Candidatus Enterococcus leclercqii]|uniref:YigZ family protein n=1 Tax=Candidatus Enterococcus leclercqii TaxID=1857218 RepID=UPI0013794866|nr:YigZ family protein [Enterococcus sp. CU9D]KAF1291866.1 YigZ family protein [Enterococcus sp. CU9D]